MKKFTIKFFLVQFILLVISYSNHYVQANQNCNSSFIVLENSISNGDGVKSTSSVSTSEDIFKIEIAEIEEDKIKFISLEKYLTGNSSFALLFPDLTPGHFFGYINESEPIAYAITKRASHPSYITFQVFRI